MEKGIDEKPVILIIDDDPDLLLLMRRMLEREGFEVYVSPNGTSLMDLIAHHIPDLILLDIHMDGIDGGTVCHLIKNSEATAGVPVFLFSANDNIERIAAQHGADGFISKPLEQGSIQKVLDTLPRVKGERSKSVQ